MRILKLILGMAAVTYLPRLLPFLLLKEQSLPPLVRRFLLFIPFAALGALIIPGGFQSIPESMVAAWLGIIAAGVCAWFKGGLIIAVVTSVTLAWLVLFLGGR